MASDGSNSSQRRISQEDLQQLFVLVVDRLIERLSQPKVKAQDLDIARKLLHDNGIVVANVDEKSTAVERLHSLLDELPDLK